MFKKAPFLPSQPRRAEIRLSTGKAAGPLVSGGYTAVREHDKGPTCLRAITTAKQGTLAGLSGEALTKVGGLFQYPGKLGCRKWAGKPST